MKAYGRSNKVVDQKTNLLSLKEVTLCLKRDEIENLIVSFTDILSKMDNPKKLSDHYHVSPDDDNLMLVISPSAR
jgi:hypothetical protein